MKQIFVEPEAVNFVKLLVLLEAIMFLKRIFGKCRIEFVIDLKAEL